MYKKIIFFCFVLTSLTLSAQMPASYGTSAASTNVNAEVISRFLFGSGNIANPFSWTPTIPSGGTDITNPNSTGNNILPCRGYSDYTIGNNNPSDGNPNNTEHLALVERGMSYEMQILGQRCSGSGWGVPANTQRGVKVYIDFNQDGLFDPNLENVVLLSFQGTGTGWFPTFNVFNVTIPANAQTGPTKMRVVYSRLGTAPFFTWFQIQPQGMYSFGETQDYSIEIAGLIDDVITTNISCNGADDGIIEIVPSAFAPSGLEYSINGMMGPFQSSAIFNGLLPNTPYDIWVRDPATGELEEYDQNSVILSEPDPLTFTANVSSDYNGSQISCTGAADGEITVTVTGGTAPFDYSIDNGSSFVATAAASPYTQTGLGDATYDVFVQDANGCVTTPNSVTITEPTILSASATITSDYNGQDIRCVGATDGQVTLTASGGTAPYQFDFDNQGLSTASLINGLGAGTYDLLVADANSCSNSYIGIVTLTDPTPLVFGGVSVASNYNGADISCFGAADGEISIVASGGTSTNGDYTFLVDNSPAGTGPSPFSVQNLGEANYSIEVQDDNGCATAPSFISLTEPPSLDLLSAVESMAISCNGLSDGELTISAQGGTGTIQYSIDNGVSYATSAINGSLSEGSYSCFIIDDNNCVTGPEIVTITEPNVLLLTGATVTSNYNGAEISCVGSTDGEITITATGGTPNFNFSVTGGVPFFPANILTGLAAGTYDVVVQDANGCETPAGASLVTISSPSPIVSSALVSSDYNGQDISCNGFSDADITVSSSGGTGTSYTYSLPAANYSGTSPYTITGLAAGGYPITVTDINGCTSAIPAVSVSQPTAIVLSTNQLDAGCNGAADGSAWVVPSGGTPSYTYLWDDGQVTANITNLEAGTYSVTTSDVNGCTQSATINILQPIISTNASDISCYGAANGTVEVVIANGNNTYTYSWNDPAAQTTTLATNLEPGVYTVTASDVFGCELVASDSVFQPTEINVNILSTTLCSAFELAKVEAEVDGGIMPYQFLWSTSESSSEIFVTDGSYNLDVTDANSCVTTQTVVVEPYSPINISFTTTPASCIDNNDGVIASTVSGGYMPYEYYWSHGPQTPTVNVAAGFYSLNLIDNEGCEASSDIAVSALDATCLELFSAFSPNGDQNNDYWYIGNIELYPDALVEVFNRWGDRVFAAKNYSNSWASAWNGMYEGKLLPSATYYYVITLNNSETPYRGNVTLVR